MHALYDYLCQHIGDLLRKHKVVILYDPRAEFLPFFEQELHPEEVSNDSLLRVSVGNSSVYFIRYQGSFFAIRVAVEPLVCQDNPSPLIVYIPKVERDRKNSVLMELEKAGTCYEPQLKRLALNILRKRYTDGQIDELLRRDNITYHDIVSFLQQGETSAPPSVLRTIFDGTQSEALLSQWLADDQEDAAIVEKEAVGELFTLIEVRLGLSLPETTTISEARDKTLRYVLVSEFCSDLRCEPPTSLSMVPTPASKEQGEHIREIAEGLRRQYADRYVVLADQIEDALNLKQAQIDAAALGNIDTFRFEEARLLGHAGELLSAKKYDDALTIVTEQNRSFWVDRDVSRQAQWEACRLMAELGCELNRVRPALSKMDTDPSKWLTAYTADNGWWQVDALQRHLETWVAKMDDEPETERALAVVRREHEELLKRIAEGFAKAFRDSAWTIAGALHQTRIYPDVVKTMGGRVGYFFVDAMRYEMGVELARQLSGAQDLTVHPAIAALPSITPVGMAALLPGASASFSVVEHKEKLAVSIEDTIMPGLNERLKFLKAKVPDVVELTLGKLLGTSTAKLTKTIGEASLIVVRSQEIDFVGEIDGDLLARQVMDTIISNLARAVRKLASVGIENFVIAADHGHQFAIRKDEDMKTDNPGNETLDIHRRCWIGHGGSTPPGTVRVPGAELGYDTTLDFIFPTGLGIFKAGGGLSFHHGGFSLQELVIPVVSLRLPTVTAKATASKQVELRDVPEKITNRAIGVRVNVSADLFTEGTMAVRVVLLAGSEIVGQTGMVIDADFDRTSGIIQLRPGTEATVGLLLTREDCESVRIVVQDPTTDAVFQQSGVIPVKLGI
ncbi:MAG: PglZ domain-containing protein [Candidatus Binatia bacterium]